MKKHKTRRRMKLKHLRMVVEAIQQTPQVKWVSSLMDIPNIIEKLKSREVVA